LLLLSNGYFAFGGHRGDINIFDLNSYKCINTVKTNKNKVIDLLLLKNNHLASIMNDISCYGWDGSPILEIGLFIFDI
jgi:hypothetical protein